MGNELQDAVATLKNALETYSSLAEFIERVTGEPADDGLAGTASAAGSLPVDEQFSRPYPELIFTQPTKQIERIELPPEKVLERIRLSANILGFSLRKAITLVEKVQRHKPQINYPAVVDAQEPPYQGEALGILGDALSDMGSMPLSIELLAFIAPLLDRRLAERPDRLVASLSSYDERGNLINKSAITIDRNDIAARLDRTDVPAE